MKVDIRPVAAVKTYPLRLAILRTGMAAEAAIFPGDEEPSTMHLGAFGGENLVGIVSLYVAPFAEQPMIKTAWQLRGMATVPAVRGQRYGAALVQASLEHVRSQGGTLLWCNARIAASGFYQRQGLQTSGLEFEIPTAGPHIRMWMALS